MTLKEFAEAVERHFLGARKFDSFLNEPDRLGFRAQVCVRGSRRDVAVSSDEDGEWRGHFVPIADIRHMVTSPDIDEVLKRLAVEKYSDDSSPATPPA